MSEKTEKLSRIGKLPVELPSGVKVEIKDSEIKVEGPKGKLSWNLPKGAFVKQVESRIEVTPDESHENARAVHGLTRASIQNLVTGVTDGFTKKLEIVGIGYRAQAKGKVLNLALGFSHPVEFQLPDGVEAKVEANTNVILTSADKQLLGQTAANIRKFRPPETFKGKGIRYAGERIRRKAGKAAAK
jgi:large subunit ribosomal protein L6